MFLLKPPTIYFILVFLHATALGDSITFGERSTDGNGYRLFLSELLTKAGKYALTFIGSVHSGSMTHNAHEGHGGFQIVPVGLMAKPDYAERPDVVLLMAGTNDIIFDVDVSNAPIRLGKVVEKITNEYPDATVLVGTLLPLLDPNLGGKVVDFNFQVPGIIRDFANDGEKVAMVDMSRVTTRHIHLDDGIHPTDEGYSLIAAAWYDGMITARGRVWI